MKDYECVEVKHHKDVGKTIEKYERNGWDLHTYQTAGMGAGPMSYSVSHYLLFERSKRASTKTQSAGPADKTV